MSGWTATECARGLRAPAGFESEEDGVGGRKAREEVSDLPVIVGGLLGLMLADHVFRNCRFIRGGERDVWPRLPRLRLWQPRPFL